MVSLPQKQLFFSSKNNMINLAYYRSKHTKYRMIGTIEPATYCNHLYSVSCNKITDKMDLRDPNR